MVGKNTTQLSEEMKMFLKILRENEYTLSIKNSQKDKCF